MILAAFATVVSAQSLEVTFDADTPAALDTAALTTELQSVADGQLKLGQVQSFLSDMADAGAISQKGMGAVYSGNMEKFVVGGAIGTGVHGVGLTFGNGDDDLPSGGFATQVTLMAGLNFGLFSGGDGVWKHIRVFGNGMYAPLPSGTPFDGTMYNAGAHLQIGGIGQVAGKGAVSWGGIDLTAGFERTNYRLGLGKSLPIDTGSGLVWNADGRFDVGVTADSVPLELSTSFRVLVVSAFVGGGYDLVTSSATLDASLSGPLEFEDDGVGTAALALTETNSGAPGRGRLFAGAEVALWVVKLYGQLNVGLDDSYGGHLGVRVML